MLASALVFTTLGSGLLARATGAASSGSVIFKRQLDSSEVGIPESCSGQCKPYFDEGFKCSDIAQQASAEAYEHELAKCGCNTAFVKLFIQCVTCAPAVFDGSPKAVIENSLQQCAANGYPVTGIDTSNLPSGTGTPSSAVSPGSSSTIETFASSPATRTVGPAVTASIPQASNAAGAMTLAAGSVDSSLTSAAEAAVSSLSSAVINGPAAAGAVVHPGLAITILFFGVISSILLV